jgi:hypothetical protein
MTPLQEKGDTKNQEFNIIKAYLKYQVKLGSKNHKHLQPLLIRNINELPEKQRTRLEGSWARVF